MIKDFKFGMNLFDSINNEVVVFLAKSDDIIQIINKNRVIYELDSKYLFPVNSAAKTQLKGLKKEIKHFSTLFNSFITLAAHHVNTEESENLENVADCFNNFYATLMNFSL